MVYKNLYNRLFLSLFFFVFYFIALNNKFLLFAFGTIIYLCIFYEILKFFKNYYLPICLYLIISYCCFTIYFFIFFNYTIFNFFVFTIIFFDSFSYFVGKFFGKNYIFKFLSPKKTVEGYLGGIFSTNISLILYCYLTNFEIKLFVILNLTIVISIIGDLIESFFKRKNNLKDSSNYLPGHGGFFDRFDSFVASIIMLTLFSLL